MVETAQRYLVEYGQFALSAVTRYEVMRGLKRRVAHAQLLRIATFCEHSIVFPLTEQIFDRASELWAIGRRTGKPHRDADLIIAATAIENRRVLVTANTPHFEWISELQIENWTKA